MKERNKPQSFEELMRPRERKAAYVEPCFLPVSGKAMIGGHSKVGKSWIAMEAARAMATGTPLFYSARFQVPKPVKVLLCDKELGYEIMGQRIGRYFADASEEELELARHNIVAVSGNADFHFDAAANRNKIRAELQFLQPNVMIVDPVSKFMDGSDLDNDHVRDFLEFIDVLIEEFAPSTGLSVLLVHHFRKPNVDWKGNEIEPLSPHNFRGGSRWYADCDTLVTMRRHSVSDLHWRLECEPVFRHGASPEVFWLDVKPDSSRPVCEIRKPSVAEITSGSRQPLKERLR